MQGQGTSWLLDLMTCKSVVELTRSVSMEAKSLEKNAR
jgi:hypothetical protein